MMYRWAELMQGRLGIYDYDQGQLVWRDIPSPSHHAFVQDVQHCADHGVTKEEVEEVFQNVTDLDVSRSSGRPAR